MGDASTLSGSTTLRSVAKSSPCASVQTRSSKEQECSAFQRALIQYLENLPEQSKMRTLIKACSSEGDAPTAMSINDYIKRMEGKKTTRHRVEKLLSPIVKVLKDYDGIINSLLSGSPFPSALIWGSLKVMIDGVYRFTSLFETIRTQIDSLASQLKRFKQYEALYGDSEGMQELLCKSYINMFRFWSQVYKDCNSCRANIFSFRINKLNAIIGDLRSDADQIKEQGSITEAIKAMDERQNRKLEDKKTDLERIEAQKARRLYQDWKAEQEIERQAERYRQIRSWIGLQEWNEANNATRHRENKKTREDGTCDWLSRHTAYSAWHQDNTNCSVLWLHSLPGFGKTILCSHAIELIRESDPEVAVVYHFYREERHTECETLRILAGQLFECYGKRSTQADQELYLKTQRRECTLENIQELIKILIRTLTKTYFFIDGLDQEASDIPERWRAASGVLDFLIRQSEESPETVRVWYSSQSRPCIKEKLGGFIILDVKDQLEARDDVARYLSHAISDDYDLDDLGDTKDILFKRLEDRVQGNFLCATLMIKELQDQPSPAAMMEFIKSEELPNKLDDYYRRIFDRIAPRQRPLACNVFALIAFARRPLRVKELREAVGLLQSRKFQNSTPQSLEKSDLPLLKHLQLLFSPMIELQDDSDDDKENSICRLFHSTALEFLINNPEVLGNNLLVAPSKIADACLGYLLQSRYAGLLTESDMGWVDILGGNVAQHHFLSYAAKYWDRHLDPVPRSEELHRRVLSFITSSNFQTCIQVQSLWVEHKFAVFGRWDQTDHDPHILRAFPKWFTPHEKELRKGYGRFAHDWRHLLTFENGEVNRCWWAALGPQNFLSKFQGRYSSFSFQAHDEDRHGSCREFHGMSTTGDKLKKLRLNRYDGKLEFICEHWTLSVGDQAPTMERRQTISAQANATNWLLYSKFSDTISTLRVGKPAPALFSPDCRFLRIGAQLFALDEQGTYAPIPGLDAGTEAYPAYVEEFASSQLYTAIATRRRINKDTYQRAINERLDGFGRWMDGDENTVCHGPREKDENDATASESGSESDSESDSSHASSNDSTDQAYETWSECSTEHEDVFEDDVLLSHLLESDLSDSSQSSSGETEDDSSDTDQSGEVDLDSSSEDSDLPPSAIPGYLNQWHGDEEDYRMDEEDYKMDEEGSSHVWFGPNRRPSTRNPQDLRVSLTIFETNCSVPRKIFHFSCIVSAMLYASPPVMHPSKALVVWPLGGGDVLFANFVENTYFVRKLRPSTQHTRHIFMKCRFSSCGKYLHMSSLEVQRKPASTRRLKGLKEEEYPLKVSLLVSTYRLCSRKTTKSPPILVHRTKVHIGFKKLLSVSNLPFTLTWTPDELYFTCSDEVLRVYRIRLFRNSNKLDMIWGEHNVLVPRKWVFLPRSASQREVYYFPPPKGSAISRIIVGSEVNSQDVNAAAKEGSGQQDSSSSGISLGLDMSPPVGCHVDETEDLGGWSNLVAQSEIPEAQGIGKLDRRLEKFDFDDDCDLEPYIF